MYMSDQILNKPCYELTCGGLHGKQLSVYFFTAFQKHYTCLLTSCKFHLMATLMALIKWY